MASGSSRGWRAAQQGERVPGDHQLLVGRDRIDRDPAAVGRNARAALGIGCLVELDAQPGGLLAHPLADLSRALADSGREHEPVETTLDCGERAELATDPPDEQVDRMTGAQIVAR